MNSESERIAVRGKSYFCKGYFLPTLTNWDNHGLKNWNIILSTNIHKMYCLVKSHNFGTKFRWISYVLIRGHYLPNHIKIHLYMQPQLKTDVITSCYITRLVHPYYRICLRSFPKHSSFIAYKAYSQWDKLLQLSHLEWW
jgi:hypothetical protein